ncbi:MAG TPA: glycosyltransferase [Spirochaetota bacterium]|nr:glycosyltransferase [Spirochaetota bacterium]
MTKPLREIKQWLFHPVAQFKRYVKWMFRLLKRFYKAIFRKSSTRYRHKRFLIRFFPWIVRLAGVPLGNPAIAPSVQIPKAILDDVDPSRIHFDPVSDPMVSVIIPVYGQLHYTLRCLASIQRNKPRVSFEVIVVDDRSPDESVPVLQKIQGLRLLCKEKNSGFIKTCNAGAGIAKGKYICFLNNDTEVMPGWLDEMVRTFSVFPGTGLVGSKLVYPDGTLQEAGGIIWRDGSAWNFGRGQDPSLPVYNYAREVDYCSGASIMVPVELFQQLGGFDTEYCPAYCEDSDLALKIRSQGHRVIYQPGSVVIHYEGKTSGTDTGSGVKAYQIENGKKLFARWQDQLSSHQDSGVDVDAAKDRGVKRRVLVLEHCTPTPDSDAGSVSVFNIMMLLREMDFQVTFIPEDNFLYMPKYTTLLQHAGVEVLYAPHVTSVEAHVKEYGTRYDLVFFFRPLVVSRNLSAIKKYCPDARTLFYTHDLHHLRMEREAEIKQSKKLTREAAEMKKLEFDAIRSMDCTIIVSEAEMALLSPQLPDAKLALLPLILDVPGTRIPYVDRKDIVFVGGYQHLPNVDAVTWFVNQVMPVMRKVLPGVRFHAVGSNPPEEVKQMACNDVIVEGFVENLPAFLDIMRVSVAPLRYGAGVKGKIGTAMASGLPVVATSMAIEGMGLVAGDDVFVGDDPEAMVQMIAAVYQSQEHWESLSKKSIDTAKRLWGAEAASKIFEQILKRTGIEVQAGKKILLFSSKDYFD